MPKIVSSNIGEELLALLNKYPLGLSDSQVSSHFGNRYSLLVPVINDLLSVNRLQLFTQGDQLTYKMVQEETAVKFEGLGPEQILVYQIIEKSGNRGIWTRDIKTSSNMPQHTLTKTLKILEQRALVKSVRSVVSKSKKLYMTFDMVPDKEITGGPWYTDQEWDQEFVDALGDYIVHLVKNLGTASVSVISESVQISGISKVALSEEELGAVLHTLVYDGRLEEVRKSQMIRRGDAAVSLQIMYRISNLRSAHIPNNLTREAPCGVCPVVSRCSDDGVISPTTCMYFRQWLERDW